MNAYEVNKTMNANVLQMKQNFRHGHVAHLSQIRLIRRTPAFIDYKTIEFILSVQFVVEKMNDMRMKNKVIAIGRQTHCNWMPNSMQLETKLNAIER